MKTLVIAEKPSVARDIARVLGCAKKENGALEGNQYIVTWALGHLVTLKDPEDYDKKYKEWNMAVLPMMPEKLQIKVIPQTGKQYHAVTTQLARKDVGEVVIATDAGREGELVARWILDKAHNQKPCKRLWISSVTDKAIREGFASLKDAKEYDNLYRAAVSRAEADWLVGINATRALTCKYNAQLSCGRVQTPTLAMIAQREQEIREFVPKPYYTVMAAAGGAVYTWKDEKSGGTRISDPEKAKQIAEKAKRYPLILQKVEKKKKQKEAPLLYDLTELQRDANKKYAYSAKETLNLMQALYEQHKLLTYPRTDSRYISDDVVPTLPDRLRAVMTGDYKPFAQELMRRRPLSTRYLVNNAKVTDHHAIIPTEEAPDLWQLSGPERNIYDLVVRRFLAVLMPPCAYEEVELTLCAGDHDFTAKGRIVSEPGWRRVYDRSFRLEDEEEDEPQTLPALEQGQRLSILGASVAVGKTPPPPRYTEAALLTAMEHPQAQVTDKALQKILAETSGLGTPATRADIIEKLFSAFYIERRGKELVPTSKGMQLVELAPEDLRSAALTAQWEDRLARIAKGQERDAKFVEEMRAYASRLVAAVKASDAKYTHDNQTRKTCPDCGKFLLLVKGKRGEMLVCPDRECGYRKSVTQVTNARCPNCFKKMELRGEGENQMFACVCGYREKLSAFQERRKSAGAGKRDVAKYLQQQKDDKPVNSGMADALAKWLEKKSKVGHS